MSQTVTWGISVTGSGDGVTGLAYAPTNPIKNTAAPAVGGTPLKLTAGFNAVAIPLGALGVLIDWPSGTSVTVTEKGITGDTGFGVSTTVPLLKSWDGVSPAPTMIGLTVSADVAVRAYWR